MRVDARRSELPAVLLILAALTLGPLAFCLAAEEEVETSIWNLTYFLSSRIASDTSTVSSRSSRITELVDALNGMYGTTEKKVAFLVGGSLLLRGTKAQIRDMRNFLALVDSPLPQVQMTLWALQVSGDQKQIADQVYAIAADVRATREAIVSVQRKLAQIARSGDLMGQACPKVARKVMCQESTIFLPRSSPLSLNESLIFLTIRNDRNGMVEELRKQVESDYREQVEVARIRFGDTYRPFRRLAEVFRSEGMDVDCEAFDNFLHALRGYRDGADGAPEALVRTGTILDRVLKAAMDAYAVDMSDLFLDPLLSRRQDSAGNKKGVSLIGRSRIVVTSGLTSGLTPQMSSSVQISRPKPFGEDLLDRAFPDKKEGSPELTGADRILAGLSTSEALLLAAALSEPVPHFAKVAPGIAVKVRPTVLPDGAAARLTIDASFGVTTTPVDPQAGGDSLDDPPAPTISTHRVETDAAVEVFDLFDISSFSMTTSHPRTPFTIPILGRLPILGRAFQWPLKPKVVHHNSVILVNTVVLPRAVNLSLFYRLWDFEKMPLPKECGSGLEAR